jgi:protein TIF31
MILQRYDLGSVKDHVDRLKLLLDGNIPTMTQLYHGGSTSTSTSSKTVESESKEKVVETEEEKADVQSSSEEKTPTTTTKTGVSSPDIELPSVSVDQPVAISGKDLAHFFYLAFGEQEWIDFVSSTSSSRNVKDSSSSQDNILRTYSQQVQKRLQLEAACKIPCTIAYGGFNPPLPHRRLLGDIAYLEVSLPHQVKMVEGLGSTMVYVTATVYGFYINRTTTTTLSESNNQQSFKKHGPNHEFILDPRPADEPCFSHTLLDCLLLYSKPLRLFWVSVCLFFGLNQF